jgi:uncharacterized protein DUF3551
MRAIVSVFVLALTAMLAGAGQGHAEISYPWCAQYGGGMESGGRNCGFWTYDQCKAAVSGAGGYCEVNAMYRGPQPGMVPPPGPVLLPRR